MVWQYGDYATKGVKEVCEFGYPRTAEQEIQSHVGIVLSNWNSVFSFSVRLCLYATSIVNFVILFLTVGF